MQSNKMDMVSEAKQKRIHVLILLIFFLLAGQKVWALGIHAEVSTTQVSVEEEIELVVTVEGTRQAGDPVLPALPAFTVIPTGTSSGIQIINTQISFKKQYHFVLVPKEEGTQTIGPIAVTIDGKEYHTDPIQITVARGAAGRRTPVQPILPPTQPMPLPPPVYPNIPREPDNTEPAPSKPYWITTGVSNRNPYVNEQILFTFRFYTSVNVGTATLAMPEFRDFWAEEVVPEKKYYQVTGGTRFVVSEKVLALFPLQSGSLAIDETTLNVEVPDDRNFFNDPFFNFGFSRAKTRHLKAPAITLNVKPLPEPVPEDFSNLVGEFSIKGNVSEKTVNAGETATLNVEIAGRGNIKDGILPKNSGLSGFKTYEDKPQTTTTRTEKGIEGKKTFKKALVPSRAGDFEISIITVSYFDPKKGSYEKMETALLALHVEPSGAEALNPVIGQDQKNTPDIPKNRGLEDLAGLKTDVPLTQKHFPPFLMMGFVIPPFLFLSVWFWITFKERLTGNFNESKSRLALGKFQHRLKNVRPTELLDAFRDYVGKRLQVHGQAFTVDEIIRFLEEHDVPRDLTKKLKKIMIHLEAANYGGLSPQELDLEEIVALVKKIDRKIKK